MKGNFGQASYNLGLAIDELLPSEHLKRAKDQLEKIDIHGDGLLSSPENETLALEIGQIIWKIKKRFDRQSKR